jgi:hypothetical protein
MCPDALDFARLVGSFHCEDLLDLDPKRPANLRRRTDLCQGCCVRVIRVYYEIQPLEPSFPDGPHTKSFLAEYGILPDEHSLESLYQ